MLALVSFSIVLCYKRPPQLTAAKADLYLISYNLLLNVIKWILRSSSNEHYIANKNFVWFSIPEQLLGEFLLWAFQILASCHRIPYCWPGWTHFSGRIDQFDFCDNASVFVVGRRV